MFRKLVSNLPFSPQLINHISFYGQRLAKENATRRLVVVFSILTLVVQTIAFVAPPQPSTAASSNDLIYGGLGSNPRDALLAFYDADGDFAGHKNLRAVFNHWGITRNDLANTSLKTIHGGPSIYGEWYSMGRNPHPGDIQRLGLPGGTIHVRPLGVWGRGAPHRALEGKRASDGWPFAVLVDCGNLALFNIPPPPNQPPPQQPPPETPPPPQPLPEKQVRNLSRDPTSKEYVDANNSTVKAGETLQYTLALANPGNVTIENASFEENLNDLLEYADVTDRGGGNLSEGQLRWSKVDIPANQTLTKTFQVKVKDPVPATPTSRSDPLSYDLCMDNVFEGKETRVCINIPPPPKIVEQASQQLPNTGPGLNAAIGGSLTAMMAFLFMRNRQLIKEIGLIKKEHHQGASRG